LNKQCQPHLQNQQEVKAVVLLARHLQNEDISYRIITPYDAQKSALEKALDDEGLDRDNKCFNVDSFQGSSSPRALQVAHT
jgi:superfamily I DNA and/or RNA helicase